MKQSLVAAAALCSATVAFGQTVDLKLTGSTAFRSATYNTIRTMYGANLTSQNPAHSASSSNSVTFLGTIPALFGTRQVIVRTSYSGSVEGVRDLTQNANVTFLSSATAGSLTTLTSTADFALSDVFQATTDYQSPELDDKKVGIVVFAWTRSVGAPAALNNMTHQQAQLLLANGTLPLGFFTGNGADNATPLYLVGRTPGSGTRAVAQADCGYGATASGSLFQFTGGAWVDSLGFSSGSGVATLLKDATANSAANGYSVGYLGGSDANGVVAAGGSLLTFNGVAMTKDNVRKGQYSFWGPQHLFTKVSPSADAVTFRDHATAGFVKQVDNTLATDAVNVQTSTMLVDRQADGGPIAP